MTDIDKPEQTAVNDSGTGATIGRKLTSDCSLSDHRRQVLAFRNKVGGNTPDGRLLSNVAELTEEIERDTPRPWATHPMQTPQGLMGWQLKLLAR